MRVRVGDCRDFNENLNSNYSKLYYVDKYEKYLPERLIGSF